MQEVLVSKIFNYTSTPTKNVEGQFWFNPSTNVLSRYNGTVWKPITVSSDDVAVLTDGSKVSLTSYLNTQIAALAEGIDSKQDKLETYKEKQGTYNNNIIITSTNSDGNTGDITLTTSNGSVSSPGNIKLECGSGSTGGSIDVIGGSGSTPGDINLKFSGTAGSGVNGGNINLKASNTAIGKAGNINISGGQITGSLGIGNGGQISISGGSIKSAAQGGNIDITAGSATGENSASGRIKLNVPDKSGIVIDKDFIELNYKGDTSNPYSNEWKCYIGGYGDSEDTTDFSSGKYSKIYLGYSDYGTEINLGGENSSAVVNICNDGSANSNIINIGTAKTTNYINIGPSDSQDSTLTLNCETLSGKTFNTEITSTSDNNHIPTSKAVYDALTLKQNTLQFYTESITDAPGYPSGSGIYKEQISLGKNNYSQTINIGGSNNLQNINLGGSVGTYGIITIGTTGNNNQIQIGRDNTNTTLEINAVEVNGTVIDKTALTESSNKLPTSQVVLNGLSAKQNTTDNNLTTTDKTIVGAINEIENKVLDSHLSKLPYGTLYFNNAKLFGSNFTIPNFPFSICATVRVDSWEGSTQGIQTIFQFGDNGNGALWGSISFINVINNPTIHLRISKNTDGTISYSEVSYFFNKDTFLGKEHTIIGVFRELESTPVNFDIYVDGAKVATSYYKGLTLDSLSGTVNYAVNTYNINYSVQSASAHPMMLRNLYVFNFDVSAPAAPYSIADYVAGRLIPPALKPSQVSLALENYTIARNATTKLVKDASGNSNDATVQGSGTVAGDNDQSIKVFVDEIKTQINQSNG